MSQEYQLCRCRECRHTVEGKAKYAEAMRDAMVEVEEWRDARVNLIDVDDGGVEYDKLVNKHANVELLILNALVNPKSTKDIFPILLAKYDELLSDGMEIREGLVKKNIIEEADYIRFCKNIVERRDNKRGMVESWIDVDEEDEQDWIRAHSIQIRQRLDEERLLSQ